MVNLKRILWHLLGGTRGGPLRMRILQAILDRPYNTNQLAVVLGHDYKTIQHHLRVLTENRLVELRGAGYGATYFPSRDLEDSLKEFQAIVARLAPSPSPPRPSAPPPPSPETYEPDVKP
jgi:DNA-binding transcriptional ArsR family regulator